MRRGQAILVIVALLAIPLALLARSGSCEQTTCMCCLMHGANTPHGKAMHCTHCSGRGKCGMSATTPDFGLNAPMPPTKPEILAALPEPEAARHDVVYRAQSIAPGFVSAPFNPPRV